MSHQPRTLPSGFEALEPFAEAWAIEGSAQRMQRRLDSTEDERNAFFAATKPLVMPALEYLDRKPLHEHDAQERRLMNLLLSFCHISLAVEMQGDAEAQHAEAARHLTITRSTADVHG